MSTPQMSYVNENNQSNMKEQRRDNNYNKRQFICRIYKRVCKCPWRLYVVLQLGWVASLAGIVAL